MAVSLAVGSTFSSYSNLCENLLNYENENCVRLCKRSSSTIEAARRLGMRRFVRPELKYRHLRYACIFGDKYRSRSTTGQRPNQRSYRKECPFAMKLKATPDGESLIIYQLSDVHNHEKTGTTFTMKKRIKGKIVNKVSNLLKARLKERYNEECTNFLKESPSFNEENMDFNEVNMSFNEQTNTSKTESLTLNTESLSLNKQSSSSIKQSPSLNKQRPSLNKCQSLSLYKQSPSFNKQRPQLNESTTSTPPMTLADLQNVNVSENCPKSLQAVLDMLQENELSTVVVLQNSDKNLLGIFYQDSDMKKTLNAFPEVMCVDSICIPSEQNVQLYVLMVEDGNGEPEIVGFFFSLCQDSSSLTAIASVFKSHNPNWKRIQCVMSDKAFLETNSFVEELPSANHMISPFHSMKTFNSEVCIEKLGISSDQMNASLTFIRRLVLSKNEEEYLDTLKLLEVTAPQSILDYFYENWHENRHQWVLGLLQKHSPTCGDKTNNNIETIHQKVSDLVAQPIKLDNLFQDLMQLMVNLRAEKVSNNSNVMRHSEAKMQYMKVLTPYAYSIVTDQFDFNETVTILDESNSSSLVQSSEGNLQATINKCGCLFFNTMGLPCRHIFKVREAKGVNVFSEDLIASRWTKALMFGQTDKNDSGSRKTLIIHTLPAERILSHQEKYQEALIVCNKLAKLISGMPTRQYLQRLYFLETLVKVWESNKEA